MRLHLRRLCIVALGTAQLSAAAHTLVLPSGASSWIAGPVTGLLAAGTALAFWLFAASAAVRLSDVAAVILRLAALASAILISVHWKLDAWLIAGLFLSCCLYATGVQRLRQIARHSEIVWKRRLTCFAIGVAVLIVALLPPFDGLGEALFSAHMVQHTLLMLVAAPLLVAARPLAGFIWAFPPPWRRHIAHMISSAAIRRPWMTMNRPLVAWSLHAVALWSWHFPGPFQAGLASDTVHTLQHLSFLLTALLFWNAIAASHSIQRRAAAVLSLLTTAIHTGILGALLTFSPRVWYPIYGTRAEHWGMTLLQDQQLGGLIMWIPAGFFFVLGGVSFAAMIIVPQNKNLQHESRRQDLSSAGSQP